MIWLDDNQCVGCGRCVEVCPNGFEMKGNKAVLKNPEADCAAQAMASCPVGAIISDTQIDAPGANQAPLSVWGQPPVPRFFPGRMGRGPRDGRGGGRGGGGRRMR